MSKYIVDIPDGVEWGVVTCRTEDGFYTRDFDSLEELNSDYINEHFGDLQDTAYQRGVEDGAKSVENWNNEEKKLRLDEAYQRGLDDAWEAARKIADMWTRIDNDELLAIFGITERIGHSTIRSLFEKQTANEAMLGLKAYEEKQKADDEIKVGDEVETHGGKRFIVTTFGSVLDSEIAGGVCADGLGFGADLKELRKTGRHFDIDKILEKVRDD